MKNITVCSEVNTFLWHKLSFEEGSAEQEPLPHLPSICFPPHGLDILTWKGNRPQQKHTQAHSQWHTCARLHTTVRNVASISQNKVSLRSGGLKRDKTQQRTLCLVCNYWKNASTISRWHEHVTNAPQIWSKGLKKLKVRAKENPTILFVAAGPQSGLFTRSYILFCIFAGGELNPGLNTCLTSEIIAWITLFMLARIRDDTLIKTLVVLRFWHLPDILICKWKHRR